MSKIRYIKKKDYEYINKTIVDYGTFFSNYSDVVTNLIIEYNGVLSSTLVVETNDGEIAGFDINLLKPYSFWNEVYNNLSFIKKIKWLYNHKDRHDPVNELDNKFLEIYCNLYKYDQKTAYTLFYMLDKKLKKNIRASDVGIVQLKLIEDKYKYQTAEINTENISSIKSYSKRGFNRTKYIEYERGVYFSVINIDEIRDNIRNYSIDCDIVI